MLFAVPALLLLPPQSPDTGAAALRHADGRVPPTMTAVRVSRPPTLDGRLDDPAWAGAVPIRGFTETDPDEGKAASESTTVMLLYDADAIYVGARVWGVNFFRWVFRKNELSQWVFKKKTETGYASRFGHLVGLRDIPSPRRLELLPYTLGRGTYDSPAAGNPFDNGRTYFGGAGLDLKYGVTSNLTLDAAVNPDFGQVESDPSFVNLTAFEQFLPERRPFFVEGASIFDFGGTGPYIRFGNTPQYFYSRRIGRPPEHEAAAPSGGFVDAPTNSTILGSAKLSGKTPGGWSLGVLDAVTAREQATLADSNGVRWRDDVEPLTNYLVGRVRREIGGHTGFGLLATAVARHSRSPAVDSLRSGAYVAAADFYHRWDNNTYSVFGSIGASYITGDTLALRVTQQQSARYYQRPDAAYLHYDSLRTSLAGAGADFSINKEGGNTIWAAALRWCSHLP